MLRPVFIAAVLLMLAACQSSPGRPHAVAGAKPAVNVPEITAAPANDDLGVILGGWADSDIVAVMSDSDRAMNRQAEKRAFTAPIGQKVTWSDSGNDISGTVLATHDGYSKAGAYCRDFEETVTITGKKKQGNARACQQSDGSWKIQ